MEQVLGALERDMVTLRVGVKIETGATGASVATVIKSATPQRDNQTLENLGVEKGDRASDHDA
eukprot:9599076-Lingulodinium_polyedra.AAC.1